MSNKLTLKDLGLNKIFYKKFQGETGIIYNPKLPLKVSYTRLVKDLQKDAIIYTIPKLINSIRTNDKTDKYINLVAENIKELIVNNINVPREDLNEISAYLNENLLEPKTEIAKIEKGLIDKTIEIFDEEFEKILLILSIIQKRLYSLLVDYSVNDKSTLEKVIKSQKTFINEQFTKIKVITDRIEERYNDYLMKQIGEAQDVSYKKVAKLLNDYPLFDTIYKGLGVNEIIKRLPKISDKLIIDSFNSRTPMKLSLSQSILRQVRYKLENVNLKASPQTFITDKQFLKQIQNISKEVYNSNGYRANLISRSNVIYAQNKTEYEIGKELGVQKFIVVGSETEPPCLICPPIWGELFDMEKDSDKIPQLHPNCRCSIILYISDKFPLLN